MGVGLAVMRTSAAAGARQHTSRILRPFGAASPQEPPMRNAYKALVLVILAACGDDGNKPPDAGVDIDAPPDAQPDAAVDAMIDAPTMTFSLTRIDPQTASRVVDTTLTIQGIGINGTPTILLTNCDQMTTTYTLTASAVTATSITTLLGMDVTRVQGLYTVTVTNGDGMIDTLDCALRIVAAPPPTVTRVVPTTAWRGMAMDNINSDVTVAIQGTGFQSTPNVRWVSTADPTMYFDAIFSGFTSSTQMTAVVPSETLMMPVGTYNVDVINPDGLSARWMNGSVPGVFTITATPPPDLVAVSPARIENGSCTSTPLTLTGTGFDATSASVWYVAQAGTTCAGMATDSNGSILCPIPVSARTATSITAQFASCPALGPYPVVVINPDGQADYWFSIEITPSSDGHLNTGAFEIAQNRLVTARWKHAVQFGFDSFSNAIVYVAGGQDAAGMVLGSVEASVFDLFGTPGPFRRLQQFGDAQNPRVPNDLTVPREGSTLVRVGKSMFSIGGTTVRSDVTTPVAASTTVERAEILSYAQMPAIMKPTSVGTTGLPVGSWYYRVSAVGPWGESLATREVVAINKGGQIQVCWVAPTTAGTTSYNVYRSLASDGRANSAALIATGQAGPCLTDNGQQALTPAPGYARGTVAAGGTQVAGTYTYRISAVVPLTGGGTYETYAGYATSTEITAADITATNASVQLAWDALTATGATYRVFRLDPATSTFKLLAGADALTTPTFTDGGVAFAATGAPRDEIQSLSPGSLSKWTTTGVPQLTVAREGLDGVVIGMDPATSNMLVARILVAGGRDGTGGTYTHHRTAESLGVNMDGTTEAAWSAETPQFANARAYYALLTTQNRNETSFPPPPEPPPCGDCGTVVAITAPTTDLVYSANVDLAVARFDEPSVIANVVGSEPIYIVAVMGDDTFAASNNQGRNDFEACGVDPVTGRLSCGATWTVQAQNDPQSTFGQDAVLYFSYLYPFYAIARETLGGTTTAIQFLNSAIGRFPVLALTTITGGQVLGTRQSASTSFQIRRAYYQMTRLLAYVYAVGGWADSHLEGGITVPAGPTGLVERHQQ